MSRNIWSQYVEMDDPVLEQNLVDTAFDSVEDWDDLELDLAADAGDDEHEPG
jgi:hypothetical protein